MRQGSRSVDLFGAKCDAPVVVVLAKNFCRRQRVPLARCAMQPSIVMLKRAQRRLQRGAFERRLDEHRRRMAEALEGAYASFTL
jgi:hypothetical protein